MSFYDSADAVYGSGAYGAASFGIVSPVIALTGVGGTALTRTIHIDAFEVDITEPLSVTPSLTSSLGTVQSNITEKTGSVSATGGVGSLTLDVDEPLASVSGTGHIGSVFATLSVTLTGVAGTGSVGTLTHSNTTLITSVGITGFISALTENIAFTVASVQGTTALGTIESQSAEALLSVSATGSVNSVTTHVEAGLTSVALTGSIGTLNARALYGANDAIYGIGRYGSAIYGSVTPTINLPSLELTGAVASVAFDGLEVDVSEVIPTGVSATVTIGLIRTIPFICQSVSATGTVGTVFLVTSAGVTGVSATGQVEQVQVDGFEIDVQERLQSVSATGAVGTLTHSNTHSIASVVGTFSLGTITPVGIIFNFEAVKTLYDRRRTSYVEKQAPRVVYVSRQSTVAERRAAA